MPRYKVTKKKFLGVGKAAKLYGPGTKRQFITVDKPYPKDKVPAGLVLVKPATKAEVKAQNKTDKVDADKQKSDKVDADKQKSDKVDADKQKSDKIEKDAVTFAGDQKPSAVQTL